MSPVRPHKRLSPLDLEDTCFPEPDKKRRNRFINPHFQRWFTYHDYFPTYDTARKLLVYWELKGVPQPQIAELHKKGKKEVLDYLWKQIPF